MQLYKCSCHGGSEFRKQVDTERAAAATNGKKRLARAGGERSLGRCYATHILIPDAESPVRMLGDGYDMVMH